MSPALAFGFDNQARIAGREVAMSFASKQAELMTAATARDQKTLERIAYRELLSATDRDALSLGSQAMLLLSKLRGEDRQGTAYLILMKLIDGSDARVTLEVALAALERSGKPLDKSAARSVRKVFG